MTNAMTIPKKYVLEKETAEPLFKLADMPYIFIVGGFIGTVYEILLTLFTTGTFEDHSGSVLTPFNYVYGIGALIMFIVLYRMKNPITIFAVGSILGGVVEFGLSLGQELIFGTVSWDYSEHFLNIGGRTTVPFMIVWGGLCLIAVKIVFPALIKLIHKIPEPIRKAGAAAIVCLMSIDAVISAFAVLRYSGRASGYITSNSLARIVDRVFNDSYMQTHFANMVLK